MRVALLALAIVLAGCTSDAPDDAGPGGEPTGTPGGLDQLSGFVIDGAIVPLEGATVSVPAIGLEAIADENGRYGLNGLPVDEPIVVIAQADGFVPSSKSISLSPDVATRLNFTLVPVPVLEPYHEVLSFDGIIACSGITRVSGQPAQRTDCTPAGAPDQRTWDIPVDSELAGAVIEVAWNKQSDAARDMNLSVQTVGFGEFNEQLVALEGESILRGYIPNAKATKFYGGNGGIFRVSVDIGRNVANDEAQSGQGFAAQQDFELFVSLFYVAPPPPTYTVDAS